MHVQQRRSVEGKWELLRGTVIDEVWSLAGDGAWHTIQALLRESSFEPEAVYAALGFLTKYGFAKASGRGEEARIKVTVGPAPKEIAGVLGSALTGVEHVRFWRTPY